MSKRVKTQILMAIILVIVLVSLAGCGQVGSVQENKVRFRLNWKPGAEHVAYYVALGKGFYQDAGIDVDISVGSGSADSVKLVAAGEFDFALAAGGNVIQGRSKGMPLLVVAVIYQDDPTSFTVLKGSGITSLENLVGKRIGVQYDSSTYPEYLALMERNGIDRSELIEVPVSFGVEPLLTGQVDAFPGFLTQVPLKVKVAGYEPYIIPFKDYGVNIYGVSIITTETMTQKDPDLVRRFVKASLKGWEYVFDHRAEAIDILTAKFPEVNRTEVTEELDLLIPLILTETTKREGLGYSSKDRWSDSIDILHEQGVIDKKIDAMLLFTNEFLTEEP